MEIPPEAFDDILKELLRRPLPVNLFRKKVADGHSNAFGLVNRRCMPCDYSRLCWNRPYLYKLLLDFAEKYVKVPWTSITVNENYRAGPHTDRNNYGDSFLVAFGSYTGGNLKLHTQPPQSIDIKYKPLIMDFTQTTHSVEDFLGNRYSLVFYNLWSYKIPAGLPPASVKEVDGKYVFYRGDEPIYDGLPHPLKGRKKDKKKPESTMGLQIIQGPVVVTFN